uniref:Cytochrome c maturation protein CcmFN n=2 Tax=Solanum tuberosum TaxID=4113 RepID=M1BES8_SOLTU
MKSQLYTPFVLRTLVDSELRSRRNRTFDGPALFYAPLYPERKMSFAPLGARRSRGSREGKRMLHLARDDKERASSIDEQRIDGALGIALFFSPFLSASSDPFVRNFFVCTEPLAESNPVPQDPISAIHPPCIYAGDVASAMGFGLCRSKMMNGIVALHSPPMRKDAAEKNGTLFRSVGCVGSRITSELFTLKFKHVGAKCYPALLLRSNRSLLMLLRRRFFALSSLWTGALVDTGREQAKRVVRNGKKDTTTSPLCWTAGANTVVSDQDQEPIRIWILTCRWFLTVGILPGSWRRSALCSNPSPVCIGNLSSGFCDIRRSRLPSRSRSAIRRPPIPVTKLVLHQGWHAGTLSELKSHSTVRRVVLAITRIAFLHFFSLFDPFCPVVSLPFSLAFIVVINVQRHFIQFQVSTTASQYKTQLNELGSNPTMSGTCLRFNSKV